MNTLIIGHGGHGKDTIAGMVRAISGLTFGSSSWEALEHAVWPVIGHRYQTKEECFNDRRNCREEWKALISAFNTPDKARLIKQVLSKYEMYVGLRCHEEFAAGKHLFDRIIWVHAPGKPRDPSMSIEFDASCMIPVVNMKGKQDLTLAQLRKIFK